MLAKNRRAPRGIRPPAFIVDDHRRNATRSMFAPTTMKQTAQFHSPRFKRMRLPADNP
jgi:hypothetical protein